MAAASDDPFLARVPVFDRFGDVVTGGAFTPVPDDWWVGIADVTDSTGAIAAGRYKAVNFAGAAVIAAMGNALAGRSFPFVFGGDGASFAVPPADHDLAARALAETAALVDEEFGLDLRTALVPVADIRAAGHDLTLALFAASPEVTYAMFSGGGLAWAEAQLKAGAYGVPAQPGGRPDLAGLSCRFAPIPSRRGTILSLIVRPRRDPTDPEATRYRWAIQEIAALVERSPDMSSPIPEIGPAFAWPAASAHLEARAGATAHGRWTRRLVAFAKGLGISAAFRFNLPIGRFRPRAYMKQVVANSDYRKYDDGLRMTIDCTPDLADRIEDRLAAAQEDGILTFGLHRQAAAQITCFTPSVHRSDHVHFVDGAAGGYAAAALRLKSIP